jgi:hypothetical protein
MAERAKGLEIGAREALVALIFAFAVLGAIAAAASGLFSPMLVGVALTLTILLIFIGNYLVKAGVMSPSAKPLWYVFVLGLVLVFYGLVQKGVVPMAVAGAGLSVLELELTTAFLYTLFIVALVGLAVALYHFTAKKRY